jgi:hypothetical protein
MDTLLHLGGIQIALDAFKSLELPSFSLPSLQGFTGNALYFIAYAQVSSIYKTKKNFKKFQNFFNIFQSQCSSSTLTFHDLEHSTFISLSHDHR